MKKVYNVYRKNIFYKHYRLFSVEVMCLCKIHINQKEDKPETIAVEGSYISAFYVDP